MTSTTYKEIRETQSSLHKTREKLDADFESIRAFFNWKQHASIIFMGCGSSYSLSQSLAVASNFMLGKPSFAYPAGDVFLHVESYAEQFENSIVVVVSRSGETSEVRLCIEALRAKGVSFKVCSINCTEDSSIEKLSGYSINIPWAYDHSVCQTRTVSCLYFAGMYILGRISDNSEVQAGLLHAIGQADRFMDEWEGKIAALAKVPFTNGVVLGDAELAGICDEGALTFKEICQLPSNYYHMLDSRHGPMVLFGEGTLVLMVLSGVDCKYELALVEDIVKRGAEVLVYSDLPADIPGVMNISFGKDLPHIVRGLPFIWICQLLTCYKAVEIGVDPDRPSGLSPFIAL